MRRVPVTLYRYCNLGRRVPRAECVIFFGVTGKEKFKLGSTNSNVTQYLICPSGFLANQINQRVACVTACAKTRRWSQWEQWDKLEFLAKCFRLNIITTVRVVISWQNVIYIIFRCWKIKALCINAEQGGRILTNIRWTNLGQIIRVRTSYWQTLGWSLPVLHRYNYIFRWHWLIDKP